MNIRKQAALFFTEIDNAKPVGLYNIKIIIIIIIIMIIKIERTLIQLSIHRKSS